MIWSTWLDTAHIAFIYTCTSLQILNITLLRGENRLSDYYLIMWRKQAVTISCYWKRIYNVWMLENWTWAWSCITHYVLLVVMISSSLRERNGLCFATHLLQNYWLLVILWQQLFVIYVLGTLTKQSKFGQGAWQLSMKGNPMLIFFRLVCSSYKYIQTCLWHRK